jgi:hypothetical protein
MRGKDKMLRKTEGYKIRWLEHKLVKQKQVYESKISKLKEKHILFIESLKYVLESKYKLKWLTVKRDVEYDLRDERAEKEMWEEMEEWYKQKEIESIEKSNRLINLERKFTDIIAESVRKYPEVWSEEADSTDTNTRV